MCNRLLRTCEEHSQRLPRCHSCGTLLRTDMLGSALLIELRHKGALMEHLLPPNPHLRVKALSFAHGPIISIRRARDFDAGESHADRQGQCEYSRQWFYFANREVRAHTTA